MPVPTRAPSLRACVVAAAAAVLVLVAACSAPEDPPPDDAPTLRLESAAAEGDAPFTPSVEGADHDPAAVANQTVVARTVEITEVAESVPATGAVEVPGDAPGLYGGSGDLAVCDTEALVAFLQEDTDKGDAWAAVLGIATASIADVIAGLTPVVLTADTLVTNHGFADGAATPHPSVLQAGTAVLVDVRGTPVVRCACGNPLLPSELDVPVVDLETSGETWDGLDLGAVVTVAGAASDLDRLTVSDLGTGELVEIPTGGAAGGLYLATSSNHAQVVSVPEPYAGTIQTSPDGATWSVALDTTPMLDIATGDGLAVAVGLDDGIGGAIHTSTDGTTWSEAIAVVDPLTAVAHGDGTWIAVGDRSFAEEGGAGDGSSGAIYRSDDGATWERVATTDPYENAELAGSGEMLYQSMTSVGYGDGTWIATATECAYRSCMRVLFTSTDTRTWTRMALDDAIVEIEVAHDGEQWGFVGGEAMADPPDNASIDRPIGAAGTSPDGLTWSIGPTSPDRVVLTGLNPGDGEWLAVAAYVVAELDDPPPGGAVYRSTDLLSWEQLGTADPWTSSVAFFGGARSAAPGPEAPRTDVGSVRIRTAGLELLAADGEVVASFPYTEPAAPAIAAVTETLGTVTSETVAGDGYCSADSTVHAWGGLQLVHVGDDAAAADWRVLLDGATGNDVDVAGPGGVQVGDAIEDVRADHPEAPTSAIDYEGVAYEYVYLDVVGELAVEVSGQDGVVSLVHAPVYVEGDC